MHKKKSKKWTLKLPKNKSDFTINTGKLRDLYLDMLFLSLRNVHCGADIKCISTERKYSIKDLRLNTLKNNIGTWCRKSRNVYWNKKWIVAAWLMKRWRQTGRFTNNSFCCQPETNSTSLRSQICILKRRWGWVLTKAAKSKIWSSALTTLLNTDTAANQTLWATLETTKTDCKRKSLGRRE